MGMDVWDRLTDGRQTDAWRLPLDGASVITDEQLIFNKCGRPTSSRVISELQTWADKLTNDEMISLII